MAAHSNGQGGQAIIFLPVVSSIFYLLLLLSYFPRLISAVADWIPYFYIWFGPSANLECMSECTARGSLEMHNKDPKNRQNSPSGHPRTTLSAISSQLRNVSTIGKNLLNSNISPPHVLTIW